MPQHELDKGSKWMIGHHANAVLYAGGLKNVRQWKAMQAEIVQPRRLPDGLIEVYLDDRKQPDHVLIEVATYAENRVVTQAMNNLRLASLVLKKVPELLVVVLRPKGRYRVERSTQLTSRLGWAELTGRWNVVEVYEQPARQLLDSGLVGLIPWVMLAQFEEEPETLLKECRQRIERLAPAQEQADLLALTQVMTRLRFPQPELLAILGGQNTIMESPLIAEVIGNDRKHLIAQALRLRFQEIPPDLMRALNRIKSLTRLERLHAESVTCESLEAFAAALSR